MSSSGDLIFNNVGSLLSNNSGSLTGVFRAPAELVSSNTGSYWIGALNETAVVGATVAAYDLTGKAIAGSEAKTSSDGRFAVPVPPDRPIVLRASLAYSGKTYVFESMGVAQDKATDSADLSAGSTLATESLLRVAGLDVRSLVVARLSQLSSILAGVFGRERIGVLSEG